jgi:rhodanese-related sulfurtransferase
MTRFRLRPKHQQFGTLLLVLVFGAGLSPSKDSRTQADAPAVITGDHQTYCGIYSVYACAQLIGLQNLQFETLVDPQFVGSTGGSSLTELSRAISSIGLTGTIVHGASLDFLRQGQLPVILHVRAHPRSEHPDHFVVLAARSVSHAILLDGGRELRIPFREIQAAWSGSAILVSRDKPSELALTFVLFGRIATGLGGASLLCIVLRWSLNAAERRRATIYSVTSRAWPQAAIVMLIGVGLGLAITGYGGAQVLDASTAGAREFVRRGVSVDFLPHIDLVEARRLLSTQAATFIDARIATDFNKGHIPGALNLFADAPAAEKHGLASQLGPDRKTVVYCSDSDCPLAADLAADLYYLGVRDIAVFPGGWAEWSKVQ